MNEPLNSEEFSKQVHDLSIRIGTVFLGQEIRALVVLYALAKVSWTTALMCNMPAEHLHDILSHVIETDIAQHGQPNLSTPKDPK